MDKLLISKYFIWLIGWKQTSFLKMLQFFFKMNTTKGKWTGVIRMRFRRTKFPYFLLIYLSRVENSLQRLSVTVAHISVPFILCKVPKAATSPAPWNTHR